MKYIIMFVFSFGVMLQGTSIGYNTEFENDDTKKLLAVFAHPDDETVAGPLLAKYAREGVEVTLVTATDGRLGTNDWSGYSAGDELASVRREETICAANNLGIDLIHLDYEDQFKAAEGFEGFIGQSRGFIEDLHQIMDEIQPDVIITFGPDGYSNHIDHRIAGVTTTQVVLSKDWEKKPALFYVGTPSSELDEDWIYRGVDDQFLTVQVAFEDQDLERARTAALCHESQFRPEFVEGWAERMRERGGIYLRPFEAPRSTSEDLFSYPSQY